MRRGTGEKRHRLKGWCFSNSRSTAADGADTSKEDNCAKGSSSCSSQDEHHMLNKNSEGIYKLPKGWQLMYMHELLSFRMRKSKTVFRSSTLGRLVINMTVILERCFSYWLGLGLIRLILSFSQWQTSCTPHVMSIGMIKHVARHKIPRQTFPQSTRQQWGVPAWESTIAHMDPDEFMHTLWFVLPSIFALYTFWTAVLHTRLFPPLFLLSTKAINYYMHVKESLGTRIAPTHD